MSHTIVNNLSPAVNGTQNFARTGFGTPKGYMLFGSYATSLGPTYDDYYVGMGASDFTREGHSSSNALNGAANTDSAKVSRTDEILRVAQAGDYNSLINRASNNGAITDGIQLNWSQTNAQYTVSALMLKEGIANFHTETVTMNGTGDTIVNAGFQPDLIIAMNVDSDSNNLFNVSSVQNVCFYDAINDTYASTYAGMVNGSTKAASEGLIDDRLVVSGNLTSDVYFNFFSLAVDANGIIATKIDSSSIRVITFVSIKLEPGYAGRTGFVNAPASSGVVDLITGISGTPQLAMLTINQENIIEAGSNITGTTKATQSLGACTDINEQFCISMRNKHGGTGGVTDVGGSHQNTTVIQHYDENNVLTQRATLDEFRDGVVALNFFTSTNDSLIGYLVISKSAPLVDPTISLPTDIAISSTTSQGTITSDQASGFIYGVVTQSLTTPTHQQIKDGQDDLGAAADSSNVVNAVVGINTLSFSGLSQVTQYYTHFTQENLSAGAAIPLSANGFITAGNSPPLVISGIPDQTGNVGVSFGYDASVHFDDPDGDPLTYTATNLPVGLSIDPVTGIISGIPLQES